ncbi:hypothetical protein CXG81DRAFT_18481 [Caulochytrium protostelioides]|uniref:Uncharacterized protein n=1 Tax=Caulochytrium protostelioides TaxID=1555241 RepID=A0A4V1IUU6_9FUNG|nr:hypothetical protein CXG81DRAFT_18481 [Caulochytrium protostelioides]|eukprot:RKP01789.1 hypothetical protein CXG81DRAFT_18481 [Caulochytrium protostelioides]
MKGFYRTSTPTTTTMLAPSHSSPTAEPVMAPFESIVVNTLNKTQPCVSLPRVKSRSRRDSYAVPDPDAAAGSGHGHHQAPSDLTRFLAGHPMDSAHGAGHSPTALWEDAAAWNRGGSGVGVPSSGRRTPVPGGLHASPATAPALASNHSASASLSEGSPRPRMGSTGDTDSRPVPLASPRRLLAAGSAAAVALADDAADRVADGATGSPPPMAVSLSSTASAWAATATAAIIQSSTGADVSPCPRIPSLGPDHAAPLAVPLPTDGNTHDGGVERPLRPNASLLTLDPPRRSIDRPLFADLHRVGMMVQYALQEQWTAAARQGTARQPVLRLRSERALFRQIAGLGPEMLTGGLGYAPRAAAVTAAVNAAAAAAAATSTAAPPKRSEALPERPSTSAGEAAERIASW